MEGVLWLLFYAAFFYFMMRYGCGAHMVHGGHGGHAGHEAGHETEAGSTKDPVCGMDVTPDAGYGRAYQGRQYRFCSRSCLDRFDAEPSRFAR